MLSPYFRGSHNFRHKIDAQMQIKFEGQNQGFYTNIVSFEQILWFHLNIWIHFVPFIHRFVRVRDAKVPSLARKQSKKVLVNTAVSAP